MLKFYNTLTHKKEIFKPINPGKVGIYSCGPTVYWDQHIGHMYAYTQWDILARFLKYLGYQVKWVMNITDVGHMTSDEDIGEDKMEKGAKREGVSVWEIADKYIKQFIGSMDLLNIQKPDILCRATEHIEDQINLIKRIEANGFTYKTQTGLVFNTSEFPGYANFARLNLKDQNAGARVEVDPQKKSPWDFLLWITNQPSHVMQWDSPWGRGFPGWHIECTAMSTKYLGEQFDIHTGGKEHIPVHHTNEVAQAFGAFGRQTANYWVHNEWLNLKGEKMSKSKGNFLTVQDLVIKGYEPLAMRYLISASHYRKGLTFDWEALDGAQVAYEKLVKMIQETEDSKEDNGGKVVSDYVTKRTRKYRQKFTEKLSNDLNTPEVLAVIWELVKDRELEKGEKKELVLEFDQVLGLNLSKVKPIEIKIPVEVQSLVEEREKLRKQERWLEADKVRRKIKQEGFVVEDTPEGPRINRFPRA